MEHRRPNGNGAGRSVGSYGPPVRGDELRAYFDTFRNSPSAKERRDAANRIILGNFGLVVSVARRYRNYGLTFERLQHEGTVGMFHAITVWDPERGKFSACAFEWIREAIAKAVRRRGEKDGASKRLDAPFGDEGFYTLHDLVGDASEEPIGTDREKLSRLLADAIAALPAREAQIIRERYGFGCEARKFREIAPRMGISHQRVQQLHAVACERIRRFVSNGKKRKEVVEAMQP